MYRVLSMLWAPNTTRTRSPCRPRKICRTVNDSTPPVSKSTQYPNGRSLLIRYISMVNFFFEFGIELDQERECVCVHAPVWNKKEQAIEPSQFCLPWSPGLQNWFQFLKLVYLYGLHRRLHLRNPGSQAKSFRRNGRPSSWPWNAETKTAMTECKIGGCKLCFE